MQTQRSIGAHLRKERQLRQVSLEELAQTTRIPLKLLQHIEADELDQLPGEVFARGYIKSYARALGIDSEPLLEMYGRERTQEQEAPAPITAITPPERGRRFGIAIALVILLILFTLALSIVLRPRRRGSVELSQRAPVTCPAEPSTPTPSSFEPSTTAMPIASSLS